MLLNTLTLDLPTIGAGGTTARFPAGVIPLVTGAVPVQPVAPAPVAPARPAIAPPPPPVVTQPVTAISKPEIVVAAPVTPAPVAPSNQPVVKQSTLSTCSSCGGAKVTTAPVVAEVAAPAPTPAPAPAAPVAPAPTAPAPGPVQADVTGGSNWTVVILAALGALVVGGIAWAVNQKGGAK